MADRTASDLLGECDGQVGGGRGGAAIYLWYVGSFSGNGKWREGDVDVCVSHSNCIPGYIFCHQKSHSVRTCGTNSSVIITPDNVNVFLRRKSIIKPTE